MDSEATIVQVERFLSMNDESSRLKSFYNWPHLDDTKCSAAKMAEAGFFHCPTKSEPDAVQCFVCLKELDGWEPNDDPWEEHQSHSKICSFAKIGKRQEDLTIKELFLIESDRHVNFININNQKKIKQLREEAEEIKDCLKQMV